MRKVLVFQHVAHEILGTLNPLLKGRGLRVRYVNFDRNPDEKPSIDRYNGLIVLGGNMGVYEADKYTHIKIEMQLIEQALKKDIPILGICLGAQILAHVLGAEVRKSPEKEIGWHDIEMTDEGLKDPLLCHFKRKEKIFQMHGDTFDLPKSAIHLASSEICKGQAFRHGDKVYGLQFHLEVDEKMILRWMQNHMSQAADVERIREETKQYLTHSTELSEQTFTKFVDLFSFGDRSILLGSGHGKPSK